MTDLRIHQITGTMVPINGDEVDTDRIIPARFLKEITFEKMGEYLFYDVRYQDSQLNPDFSLNQEKYQGASIMLVGKNFGCGSSREHAPQAIKRAGFTAIIGESFAEIFSGNCKSLGLVTITLDKPTLDRLLDIVNKTSEELCRINIEENTLWVGQHDQAFKFDMKTSHRHAFLNGTWDELALLAQNDTMVTETAERLPYFHW